MFLINQKKKNIKDIWNDIFFKNAGETIKNILTLQLRLGIKNIEDIFKHKKSDKS